MEAIIYNKSASYEDTVAIIIGLAVGLSLQGSLVGPCEWLQIGLAVGLSLQGSLGGPGE